MANIKLVITDLDGCLTDGMVQYYSDGVTARGFSVIDGAGFSLLKYRAHVAVVTSSVGNDIDIRMKHLQQYSDVDCYLGVGDKAQLLEDLMDELSITGNEVAYLGDDINDLGAMELCGVVACPTTARGPILDLVMRRNKKRAVVVGFPHAFRNFVDWLIDKGHV